MRTIPIASFDARPVHDESGCSEEDGAVREVDLPLARREFLKGSGVLIGVLASGSLLASLAPSRVWAVELKTLTKDQGETLMAMGRVLYPHKKLPDAVYALLAKDLDAKAATTPAATPEATKILQEGIASLDAAAGGSFVKAPPARKVAIVQAMEGSPFFNMVRGQCITSLYDNDMAYAALGYPGASWDKGGYITRGFQDLKWLNAPPVAASPPPYMG
jgi:hypothetical protein